MPAKKPLPAGQRPQSEDFIETARRLSADESREKFEENFKAIASAKSGTKGTDFS